MKPMPRSLLFLVAVAALFATACSPEETETSDVQTETAVEQPEAPEETTRVAIDPKTGPVDSSTAAPGAIMPRDGEEIAVLITNYGRIVLKFFPDAAPNHVDNFKNLVNDEFYNGVRFHRVIPGFMIQGGDPNTKDLALKRAWGSGGPGYSIDDELNDIEHEAGILSMAHAGPNTGGSQFFIMVGRAAHLDGVHTAFGQVIEGMDVVSAIVSARRTADDRPIDSHEAVIESATIERFPLE